MNQEDIYYALKTAYDSTIKLVEKDGHDWSALSIEEQFDYLERAGVNLTPCSDQFEAFEDY
jgi:hypothetical protein